MYGGKMRKLRNLSVLYILLFVELRFTITSGSPASQILPHEKCSLEDSDCLTTQAQKTLQAFMNGIPELGIPQQDKIYIDTVEIKWGNFTYKWTDITLEGLKNTIIDSVSINMDLKMMRLEFHATLSMESIWESDGLLFSTLYITGTGRAHIILNNFHVEMLIPFDIIKNDQGKDVMELKTYYSGFDVDNVHYQFDNTFSGDKNRKEKSEKLHALLNKNWRTVVANFSKYFNGGITSKIFELVKKYMRSRPLEDLAIYNNTE